MRGTPRRSSGARASALWLGAAAVVDRRRRRRRGCGFAASPRPPCARADIQIERITASGFLTHVALSPDGKYLAYTDNPGGRQSLWVRQVDGTNPLELIAPRTVGYWGVAFARDGASIFYAVKGRDDPDGSIYQIPFLGGPSRKILTGVDSPPVAVAGRPAARLPARRLSRAWRECADDRRRRWFQRRVRSRFAGRRNSLRRACSSARPGRRTAHASVTSVRNSADAATRRLVTVGLAGDEAPLGEAFTEIGSTSWLPDGCRVRRARAGGLATGGGGQIWMQPYPRGRPRA